MTTYHCLYCGCPCGLRVTCPNCDDLLDLDPEYAETTEDVLAMRREPVTAPVARKVAR